MSKEEKILDFGLYRLADKMLAFFQRILDWIKSLFWKEEMELTLVGLQYSGKTTFVNVIAVSVYLRLLCFVLNFNYQSSVVSVLRIFRIFHAYFTLLFVFKNRKFFLRYCYEDCKTKTLMKDKFMKLVHTIPTVTCYALLVVEIFFQMSI